MSSVKEKPKLKLEKVVWKDHFSVLYKQGWQDHHTPDLEPVHVCSVGVKMAENREVLILAQNYDKFSNIGGNTIAILKNCIVSRKVVR